MIFRLCLALLATLTTIAAPPSHTLEAGIVALEAARDFHTAKVAFRKVATDPASPPRVAAEALWRLADAYQRQGTPDTAALALRKLTADFPNVKPFAKAAADLALELSRNKTGVTEAPNSVDYTLTGQLSHLLETALRLGEATPAHGAGQTILECLDMLAFEFSLEPLGETKEQREGRVELQKEYAGYQNLIRLLLAELEKNGPAAALKATDLEMLHKLQEAAAGDEPDFNITRNELRRAMLDALAARDQPALEAAVAAEAERLKPLADSSEESAMGAAIRGGLAVSRKMVETAAKEGAAAALHLWLQHLRSSPATAVVGHGMLLPDAQDIPADMAPRLLAALMDLELAVYYTMDDPEPKSAQLHANEAQEKIASLLEDPAATGACRRRLERVQSRLKDAQRSIKSGDLYAAGELLSTEMFTTE
jgi:hypothetical protein